MQSNFTYNTEYLYSAYGKRNDAGTPAAADIFSSSLKQKSSLCHQVVFNLGKV